MGAPPPPSRGSGRVHWGLPRARPGRQVRHEIELEMAGRNERAAARRGWGWQEGSRLCGRNFMVFMLWINRELFSAPFRVRTSPDDHQRFQPLPPPRPEHGKALLRTETEMEGSKDGALVEEAPGAHSCHLAGCVQSTLVGKPMGKAWLCGDQLVHVDQEG